MNESPVTLVARAVGRGLPYALGQSSSVFKILVEGRIGNRVGRGVVPGPDVPDVDARPRCRYRPQVRGDIVDWTEIAGLRIVILAVSQLYGMGPSGLPLGGPLSRSVYAAVGSPF